MIDPQLKTWIDNATIEELLKCWRFSPAGNPLFNGETGEYYSKVMNEKRAADPGEYTAASKRIGW